MHKRFFFSASLLLVAVTAAAHRGVGIVMDSRGTVFYTDLSQVWKIEPGGRKTVAVANVHTHELYLDGDDNLYGEHLWYEGEATDRGAITFGNDMPMASLNASFQHTMAFAMCAARLAVRMASSIWSIPATCIASMPPGA